MSTCAILFIKNPVSGKVKTRLQPQLTADQAADVYRAFVLDSVELLGRVSAQRRIIAYAPASQRAEVEVLLGAAAAGCELEAQPETDLGGRLAGLMRSSFAAGSTRTVIIGSDTPSLAPEIVDEALEKLRDCQVALGPSTDGGYYLVGQARDAGDQTSDFSLFEKIEWSTGQVLKQTLVAIGERSLGLLPPWYDVDTAADAAFLKVHLQALALTGKSIGRHSLWALRSFDLPNPS